MIEAPEARYLCEQLNATVKGKRITFVTAMFTPHKFALFNGSPDKYAEQLSEKVIGLARPQGGMVEIERGNGVLQDILYNARIHPRKKQSILQTKRKKLCSIR